MFLHSLDKTTSLLLRSVRSFVRTGGSLTGERSSIRKSRAGSPTSDASRSDVERCLGVSTPTKQVSIAEQTQLYRIPLWNEILEGYNITFPPFSGFPSTKPARMSGEGVQVFSNELLTAA